jgi:hypothetical protein
MRTRSIAVALLCAITQPALASHLGLSLNGSDPSPECQELVLPVSEPATLHIVAVLQNDAAALGITGADLRLEGWPATWFGSVTPNPAAHVTLGNPLTGCATIGFPTCITTSPVVLYTVSFLPAGGDAGLSVRGCDPSTEPPGCPLLVLCNAPAPLRLCVTGGRMGINRPGFCTTGVTTTAWSHVRALYR